MLAENLYIHIEIFNYTRETLHLSNANLEWGKFHKDGDKGTEYSSSHYEGEKIESGKQYDVFACGRQSATSGTEGTIDILNRYDQKVCTVYWDCPWGSSPNKFVARDRGGYIIKTASYDPEGAIGTVWVKIYDLPGFHE